MTIRTTLEFDHDHLDSLNAEAPGRRRNALATLLLDAVSGDPRSAERLEKKFGLKIVAQKSKTAKEHR